MNAAAKPARGTLKRARTRRRRWKVKARRSCVGIVRYTDKTCRYRWTTSCQQRRGRVQFERDDAPNFGTVDENPPRSLGGDPTDPQVSALACLECHQAKTLNKFHVHYLSRAGARGPIGTCEGPKKHCLMPLWIPEAPGHIPVGDQT